MSDIITTSNNDEPTLESVSIPTSIITVMEISDDDNNNDGGNSNHSTVLSPEEAVLPDDTQLQISLDDKEQALFDTLQEAAQAYNDGKIKLPENNTDISTSDTSSLQATNAIKGKEPLFFRVAGGWVRDKLLKLETHDIDIAVNNLTGEEAARLVKEFITQRCQSNDQLCDDPQESTPLTNATKLHRQLTAGKIGVIAANPAQSKHLETATMRIGDIDVDFCNLRGMEVYGENSRIPTTSFGTALQDATRRDFTVNALFYNLNTKCVEDWTKRGIQDLRIRQIVTPIDPFQTFIDDPLRVLRAIRFAMRYKFTLDPALEDAARNITIHQALHAKVTRERVGKELETMLSGKGANPILALQTISRLKLAGSVFALPIVGQNKVASMKGLIAGQIYTDKDHDGAGARHIREVGWESSLRHLEIFVPVLQAHEQAVAERSSNSTSNNNDSSTYDKRLTAVAAFLLPFRTLTYQEKGKHRDILSVTFVFKQGIKFRNIDVQVITNVMGVLDDMAALLSKAAANQSNNPNAQLVSRLDAGIILLSVKESWVTSLLLAAVLKIEEQHQPGQTAGLSPAEWIQISVKVYQSIIDLGLDKCWKMKPLMNGTALIEKLSLPRGPIVKQYQDEQSKWMLVNPNGSEDDCETHLRSFKRKLQEQQQGDGVDSIMIDGMEGQPSSKKMHL